MLTFEIKYDEEPESNKSMSEIMEDLIAIEEKQVDGARKKSAILQFEKINKSDHTISFRSNDTWDIKENMVYLVKSLESLDWINNIREIKRDKK